MSTINDTTDFVVTIVLILLVYRSDINMFLYVYIYIYISYQNYILISVKYYTQQRVSLFIIITRAHYDRFNAK